LDDFPFLQIADFEPFAFRRFSYCTDFVMLPFSSREYFEDEFCEWYEPGGKKKGYSRKPNQTMSLETILLNDHINPKPY
jgi:hypothetical protein